MCGSVIDGNCCFVKILTGNMGIYRLCRADVYSKKYRLNKQNKLSS